MDVAVTTLGQIKGRRFKTRQNKHAFSFRAIPYANPPTGDRRFSLPEPVDPWPGILDCSRREAQACLQVNILSPDSKHLLGSEDCLYLNVYTPHLPLGGKRPLFPVIVFFHGGAFCVSSSDSRLYGGQLFLDYGVVLVTVNYRLGPLGFFTLESDAAPGNLGMHDQVLALHWVQQHIGSFGGDQTNVTIMGESAGGMSCLMHLVSPLSRGLFQKVICMSASASTPFLHHDRRPSIYSRALANTLGADVNAPDHRIVEHLRNIPANDIVAKSTLFKDWDYGYPMPWKPNIDSYTSRPFLPQSFEDLVKSGDFAHGVPVLAGINSEEGLILSASFHKAPRRWEMLFKEWNIWAPQLLFNRERDLISETDRMIANQVLSHYFDIPIKSGNYEKLTYVPEYNEANLSKLEQLFSVSFFFAPFFNDVRLLSSAGVTVFPYLFSYAGSMTLVDIFRLPFMKMLLNFSARHLGTKLYQKDLGVCHGDDLLYMFPFNPHGFPPALSTSADQLTSRMLLTLWTNMAKHGDPTPDHLPRENNTEFAVKWDPAPRKSPEDEYRIPYLRIGSGLAMECDSALWKRVEFWFDVAWEANELYEVSDKPVSVFHENIAEKRNLPLEPKQLSS